MDFSFVSLSPLHLLALGIESADKFNVFMRWNGRVPKGRQAFPFE
jgi:hypothetical protein